LVLRGFCVGSRVTYIGARYPEQFKGVELIVDSINERSEITCRKPDGFLTAPLKPEELKAVN
jgi:hypothetical protein